MNLTIHNIEHYVHNHSAQVAVMQKLAHYTGSAIERDDFTAELFCTPRQEDGWLEWHLVFKRDSHRTVLGMIQRGPDLPFEFHS